LTHNRRDQNEFLNIQSNLNEVPKKSFQIFTYYNQYREVTASLQVHKLKYYNFHKHVPQHGNFTIG